MSPGDTLRRICAHLEKAGIPYMVAGSVASGYHGEIRMTRHIDIVIAPDRTTLTTFVRALPEAEYYADLDSALDALVRASMFNVIDMTTGWKIDLVIKKRRAFSEAEFERRIAGEVFGVPVSLATAEDTVIAKLEWAAQGGSEQQLRDVAVILDVRPGLDRAYIERWISSLGLDALWQRVRGG